MELAELRTQVEDFLTQTEESRILSERDRDYKDNKQWTAEEVITYAYGKPASFKPGRCWEYSNTNYILAGLIIDEVVGHHHSQEIRSRILEPMGMNSTYDEHHEKTDGFIVHGYDDRDRDGYLEDFYGVDQGYGLADRGMLSTVGDLAVYVRAIARGKKLLTEKERRLVLHNMVTLLDGEGYGFGIYKWRDRYGKSYGHNGGLYGNNVDMTYYPAQDVTIIVFVNGSGGKFDRDFYRLTTVVTRLALSVR